MAETLNQATLLELLPRSSWFDEQLITTILAEELAQRPLGKPGTEAVLAAQGLAIFTRALLRAEVEVYDAALRGEGRSGQLLELETPELYERDSVGDLVYRKLTDQGSSGLLIVRGLFDGLEILDTAKVKPAAIEIAERDLRPGKLIICVELGSLDLSSGLANFIPLKALENPAT